MCQSATDWRPFVVLLALASVVACAGSVDQQYEPPRLAEHMFDASADGTEAFAYITREDRFRPGPVRLGRRYDRYRLHVRRLPDGAIVNELLLGDIMDALKDSTPRIIGVSERVLWVQQDSVLGFRVPSLEVVPLAAAAENDDARTATLRDSINRFAALPFWQKPGQARLFTSVKRGLQPLDRTSPISSLSLANAGVLRREDRSAWALDDPASVLVMSADADSTWSVSRVSVEGNVLWTTPLGVRFSRGFVLLDAATHVVFMDAEPHADRAGARDRVVWVNAMTGAARVLEIATGDVSAAATP